MHLWSIVREDKCHRRNFSTQFHSFYQHTSMSNAHFTQRLGRSITFTFPFTPSISVKVLRWGKRAYTKSFHFQSDKNRLKTPWVLERFSLWCKLRCIPFNFNVHRRKYFYWQKFFWKVQLNSLKRNFANSFSYFQVLIPTNLWIRTNEKIYWVYENR